MPEKKELTENATTVESTTDKTVANQPEDTKPTKRRKKSSALVAASMGRSAVNAVQGHASGDVRGSSDGTSNTGIIISYDNED
ncbi:MAG: hypothetical protein ABIU63_12590 [Chitinophagaceae bacterium]